MINIFFILALFSPFITHANENQSRPKVCLNMIVKNESHVICRCLSSVLPIIDYWVIVDTGSSDGTQQVIIDYMKKQGIPGELHERPWKNFGHNRNEALNLARNKSDYIFFIDADEYLVYDSNFKFPHLDKDYYYIKMNSGGMKYSKIHFINDKLEWKWEGVLHEVLTPPYLSSSATVENVMNMYTTDGARSKDPQKYQKDAQVLEAALIEQPNNSRYTFYLAKSYSDCQEHQKALTNYEKRAEMGGWEEEVFFSLLQVGILQEHLGMPFEKVIGSYNKAYQYRKARIEPLYYIAHLYRTKEDFHSGYLIGKIAQTLPPSTDILFVSQWMYDYGIELELSICAYWIGKYEECQQLSIELLKKENLPSNVRDCIKRNLEFANAKLIEKICLPTL